MCWAEDGSRHVQVPTSVFLSLVHVVKRQSIPDVQRGDPPLQGLTGRTQVGLKVVLGAGWEGSGCRREALVVKRELGWEVPTREKQRGALGGCCDGGSSAHSRQALMQRISREGLGLGLGVRPLCPSGPLSVTWGGACRKDVLAHFRRRLSGEEEGLR